MAGSFPEKRLAAASRARSEVRRLAGLYEGRVGDCGLRPGRAGEHAARPGRGAGGAGVCGDGRGERAGGEDAARRGADVGAEVAAEGGDFSPAFERFFNGFFGPLHFFIGHPFKMRFAFFSGQAAIVFMYNPDEEVERVGRPVQPADL